MKSIKPGRGPSAMNGVGALIAAGFGVIWTIAAVSMGAPGFFPLFGALFIVLGIAKAVYYFKNAHSRNRTSLFDIVDGDEEPDPFHPRCDAPGQDSAPHSSEERYCPYCGEPVGHDFVYCDSCGKKLP